MLPDHLYDYPFDLYQRTRDITEIVNIIAADSGKKKLRILDVGGFRIDAEERETLLLREFLPDHEIFALDLNECFIPGYVKGDGTNLPFKDGVFDIVVTSDVYEHIPGNLRSRFIENLIRTSNAFVILGAPFYSPEAELGEKIIFEYVRKVLFAEQAQLKEHIDNRLPETG
ncbi:MAG: class I SAM-dependent methyltransferase, partial [bacterium]|nr:class I SAM-dependent methyltransferase [bacterium]